MPDPAPSPICTVNDGGGTPLTTTAGVEVTPGNTITVALANSSGVTSWSLSIIGTDGSLALAPVLTISLNSATFTAPSAGSSLIVKSTINDGLADSTFGIYTLDAQGNRANPSNNSSQVFGMGGVFNVMDYGATGDGTTDDLPSVSAAIKTMSPDSSYEGGTLFFPARPHAKGDYFLNGNLHIGKQIILTGVSGGDGNGRSCLKFSPGHGIVIDAAGTNPPLMTAGAFSQVRDIDLYCSPLLAVGQTWVPQHRTNLHDLVYPTTRNGFHYEATSVRGAQMTGSDEPSSSSSPANPWPEIAGLTIDDNEVTWTARCSPAILAYQQACIRDVWIHGATDSGIHFQGNSSRTPITNVNGWRVQNVFIMNVGGHGVFAIGYDANAGVCIGAMVQNVRGVGICDRGFLGNTWVACQVAAADLGGYQCRGTNANSIFVGCYNEGGQPPNDVRSPAIWIGGTVGSGWVGERDGMRFLDGVTIPLEIVNRKYPNSPRLQTIRTYLGSNSNYYDALGWETAEEGSPYMLCWNPVTHRWHLRWANTDGFLAMTFSGAQSNIGMGAGNVGFPNGLYLGKDASERRIVYLAALPTAGGGQSFWNVGDRIYNSAPVPGGFEGWVCTEAGGWGSIRLSGSGYNPGSIIIPSNPTGYIYQRTGATAPAWVASASYTHNSFVQPTARPYGLVYKRIGLTLDSRNSGPWRPNIDWPPGYFVQAPGDLDYVYEVTLAGQSGATEPDWLQNPVVDGTAELTRRLPTSGLVEPKWPAGPPGVEVDDGTCHWQAEYGNSATQEPANWPTTMGTTIDDGHVVWTCVGRTPPTFKEFGIIQP